MHLSANAVDEFAPEKILLKHHRQVFGECIWEPSLSFDARKASAGHFLHHVERQIEDGELTPSCCQTNNTRYALVQSAG